MNDLPEPTLHLLSLLLGKRTTRRVYRRSLADLYLLQPTESLGDKWLRLRRKCDYAANRLNRVANLLDVTF